MKKAEKDLLDKKTALEAKMKEKGYSTIDEIRSKMMDPQTLATLTQEIASYDQQCMDIGKSLEERVEHLDILRQIQLDTGGFNEFIPMTFMHEHSPIFLEGQSDLGATGTQDLKLYAVARLMFRDIIPNIQVSWVKMGFRFAQVSLLAGANDLGGTLGGDELSEASGAPDGVNASIKDLTKLVKDLGRVPLERNSTYTEFYPIDL